MFVETDVQLAPANRAQVVRADTYTREALEPVPAALRELLSVQDVQGIVSNARQQLPSATPDQFVEALQDYVLKDAFIDLPEVDEPRQGLKRNHSNSEVLPARGAMGPSVRGLSSPSSELHNHRDRRGDCSVARQRPRGSEASSDEGPIEWAPSGVDAAEGEVDFQAL